MKEELLGKSTVRRRKIATSLAKSSEKVDCEILMQALFLEEKSTNNWETKAELVKAIGMLGCKNCLNHLWDNYIHRQSDSPLVDMRAATAFVRLQRFDLADISPILKIFDCGRYAVSEGALEALGYDKMIPSEDMQTLILNQFWDFGKIRERGFTDPRYGLAAACAGWNAPLVAPFLIHCLESKDIPLEYVASNSLKRKYVKLR